MLRCKTKSRQTTDVDRWAARAALSGTPPLMEGRGPQLPLMSNKSLNIGLQNTVNLLTQLSRIPNFDWASSH